MRLGKGNNKAILHIICLTSFLWNIWSWQRLEKTKSTEKVCELYVGLIKFCFRILETWPIFIQSLGHSSMGLLALLQAVGNRPAVANDWNTMVMKDKKLRNEQLKQDNGVHNKDTSFGLHGAITQIWSCCSTSQTKSQNILSAFKFK